MPGHVEWIPSADDADVPRDAADEDSPGSSAEDVVDVGHDSHVPIVVRRATDRLARIPVVLRWALGGLAAAAVVFTVVTSSPSVPPTAPQTAAPNLDDGRLDRAPASVAALARDTRPLVDYVRSDSAPGSCSLVPVGSMPQSRLTAAVRTNLPEFTITDIARTLDQFTALCMMQLRAHDALGTTLVVQIAAAQSGSHNDFEHLVITSQTDGASTVAVATAVTDDGWTVTVGSLGPAGDQPSSATLMSLAQDPSLLW